MAYNSVPSLSFPFNHKHTLLPQTHHPANTTMSTDTPYKFEGWAGLSKDATSGKLQFQPFEPKAWDEDDVDVRIQYCGICGTDISALEGEFGPLPKEGSVCGHEGVGEVVRVGSKVEGGLKVGDIVGIGIQTDSCRECEWCMKGEENVCAKQVSPLPSSIPTHLSLS